MKSLTNFFLIRSQRLMLDAHECDSLPITSGMPQEPVLGLVLFVLFTNDLQACISSPVSLFALYPDIPRTNIAKENGNVPSEP